MNSPSHVREVAVAAERSERAAVAIHIFRATKETLINTPGGDRV